MHYIEYCTGCNKVISQCRCAGTKEIRFGLCTACKEALEMPCKPCEEKKKAAAPTVESPTPEFSFLTIHCYCGLRRIIPDGLKVGDEFNLIPCPKCGNAFHGRVEEGGVREILG